MNQAQACPICRGDGSLHDVVTGSSQVCPNCSGSGGVTTAPAFYTYVVNQVLAANGNATVTLTVVNNPFVWAWKIASSTGSFKLQSQHINVRVFESDQVNQANSWGTAQNPFPVLVPYRIPVQGVLQFSMTDLSGAQNTVQLALVGWEEVSLPGGSQAPYASTIGARALTAATGGVY